MLLILIVLLMLSKWIAVFKSCRSRAYRHRSVAADTAGICRRAPKPLWVRREVIRLKALGPDLGCRAIASIFNRRFRHKTMTVGKTFVADVLRKHGYDIHVARQQVRHRRLRPGPKNVVWGMDLTGKTDSEDKLHSILGIVDHGSRANLSLQALPNKATITVLRVVLDVIERYGKPKILRTDNEAVFTSRLFRFSLWVLGIRHQRIEPLCPWQNGRVERFFGTLKKPLDRWAVSNINALNTSLAEFRLWYNHVRPHQSLHGQTPAEVWQGINVAQRRSKKDYLFTAWEGLLVGYYLPP